MEADPTRMCELMVGLGEVDLVGIDDVGEGTPLGGGDPVPEAPPDLWGLWGGGCLRVSGRWCWWICRRSGGRFGCDG